MRLKKVFEFHHGLWTPNKAFFIIEIQNFWLGQSNWTDIIYGVWSISGRTVSNHFVFKHNLGKTLKIEFKAMLI